MRAVRRTTSTRSKREEEENEKATLTNVGNYEEDEINSKVGFATASTTTTTATTTTIRRFAPIFVKKGFFFLFFSMRLFAGIIALISTTLSKIRAKIDGSFFFFLFGGGGEGGEENIIMARILTYCIRRRKSPVLWEDTEKEQIWITVADEENGNDVTSQVKLNEDGELPLEEIVKVFPDARGKDLELFTSRDHSVPISMDSSGRHFVANAKMNFMWQTKKDRSYFLEIRRRDKPPRPPPPAPKKQQHGR